jgi:hypothetical protein
MRTKQWYIFVDEKGGIYFRHLDDMSETKEARAGQVFGLHSEVSNEIGAPTRVKVLLVCSGELNLVLTTIENMDAPRHEKGRLFELEDLACSLFRKAKKMASLKRRKKKKPQDQGSRRRENPLDGFESASHLGNWRESDLAKLPKSP